jgi:hypothetical protein
MDLKLKRSREKDDQGEYFAVTPEIDGMAKEIMRVFLEVRTQYCPGMRGGSRPTLYYKAARAALAQGVSGEDFVMRRVPQLAEYGVWYPQALESDKIEVEVERKTNSRRLDAIDNYTAQLGVFSAAIKVMPPLAVLGDQTRGFSPLFRCVMGIRFGFHEIVSLYRDDARRELAERPVATELFGTEVKDL